MSLLKSKIIQLADYAIRFAFSKYQLVLDFSPDSLSKLEVLLDIEKNILNEKVSENSDVHKQSRLWGIYFGEVLRKNIGGSWEIRNKNPLLTVYGNSIDPVAYMYDRFQGLATFNIYSFCLQEIQKIRDSDIAGFDDGLDTTLTQAIAFIGNLEKSFNPDTSLADIREKNKLISSSPSNELERSTEHTSKLNNYESESSISQSKPKKRFNLETILISILGLMLIVVGIIGFSTIRKPIDSNKPTPLSELPPTWTPSVESELIQPIATSNEQIGYECWTLSTFSTQIRKTTGFNPYFDRNDDPSSHYDYVWVLEANEDDGVHALYVRLNSSRCISEASQISLFLEQSYDSDLAAMYGGVLTGTIIGNFTRDDDIEEWAIGKVSNWDLEDCTPKHEEKKRDNLEQTWLYVCTYNPEDSTFGYGFSVSH